MPIVVDYNPSAALVGKAGYESGAGSYRKYLDEKDYRNRSLNQQRDLTLADLSQRDRSQYLGIAASERALGANLANSQWQTQAGIAGQSFLQQQNANNQMASQVYGAGVGASMQTQQLQTNSLLQFQDQLFKNDQLIKQLQQQQASQQYGAAVDVGMQAQRLNVGLQGQALGIAADEASQNRQIFASGMQQQEGIRAEDRQQAASIAANRQNTLDTLQSGDWRTQYGAAIDQQNLSAQLSNQQWMQGRDLESARQRQESQIIAENQRQLVEIQAKKELQRQSQEVEAVFRNQDVAVQQQNLIAQMQQRKEEMAFNAWTQQQNQMMQQQANERMALFENSQQNARLGYQTQAGMASQYNNQMYEAQKLNAMQQFEAQQTQAKIDAENAQASQSAEYRKAMTISQLTEARAKAGAEVAAGRMRPEEFEAINQQISQQMGTANQSYQMPKQPTAYENYQANSWIDPVTSSRMYLDPSGRIQVVPGPKDERMKQEEFAFRKSQEEQKMGMERMTQAHNLASNMIKSSINTEGLPTMSFEDAYDLSRFDLGMKDHRQQDVERTMADMEAVRAQYPQVAQATQVVERLTQKASGLRNKIGGLTMREAAELQAAQAAIKQVVGSK